MGSGTCAQMKYNEATWKMGGTLQFAVGWRVRNLFADTEPAREVLVPSLTAAFSLPGLAPGEGGSPRNQCSVPPVASAPKERGTK